jgi:protein-L-isoaspartate(D-aspartate) O-methyltransferase
LSTVPKNKDLKRLVRARMAAAGENYTQALTALELRAAMADQVAAPRDLGKQLSDAVLAALRTVPRHLFTPGVPLARAYEDIYTSIVTKTSAGGTSLSSVTAPWIIAGMLAQLDVRPGHSVLEIGSGGYQAALLRELVGPEGLVTTVDIDPEVTARARACLDLAGYGDVRTLCADGEYGAPGHGPFDRIIVAVQARDIPLAWTDQLTPDGRLVVPLLTRGVSRSWELAREDGHLVSRSNGPAGFVPMQGAGKHRGWRADDAGVRLWSDEPADVDRAALAGVLATERSEAWSGVTLPRNELITGPDLWLATDPDHCQLRASQDAVDRGVVVVPAKINTPALASGGSLAYRALLRPVDHEGTAFEFGAYGHGPRGAELAQRLAGHIRTWDRDHRHGPDPVLAVHPAGTPASDLPRGCVLHKRHTTMVLSWPEAAP